MPVGFVPDRRSTAYSPVSLTTVGARAYGSLYVWARHLTHGLVELAMSQCLRLLSRADEISHIRPREIQPGPARVHISHNVAIYSVVPSSSLSAQHGLL